MAQLWLKFANENGETERVLVEGEEFTVGRHSDNNLTIANGKLSREHMKIERFADVFFVSDCGSSNGTTLNGVDLTGEAELRNGDILNLGGGLEIEVESVYVDADTLAENSNKDSIGNQSQGNPNLSNSANAGAQSVSTSSTASASGSIPTSYYYLAPAFVMTVLLLCGGLFFAFSGKDEVVKRNDFIYQRDTPNDLPKNKNDENSKKTPKPTPSSSVIVNTSNSSIPETTVAQTSITVSSDVEKVKQNSASFMRRIALNDEKPYLENNQANLVNEKIKSVKNSSSLIENMKAVKKDAAQFESLASSKNLKPQFLAAAALTGLGNERGSPVEKAKEILPILSGLKVNLDNRYADDNLLIIAAFNRGKAGKYGSLSGVIEALSKKLDNASPRQIRTIWFLKEQNKISGEEFEFALQFLAVGAIMQNPSDFGVQTEAVTF